MASTDDFTFPIVTDTSPSTIDSPPLWRLSPTASPTRRDSQDEEEDEGEGSGDWFTGKGRKYKFRRRRTKSYSDYRDDDEEEEEEKMDVLWEDFNEELSSSSSGLNCSSKRSSSDQDTVDLGYPQALKLSKTPGGANAILSTRNKPGFVVFVNVLKKLFLLHNSNRRRSSAKNNRTW